MQPLTDLVTHIVAAVGIEEFPFVEQNNNWATGSVDPLCQALVLRRHAYRCIDD
jgi:multisubunit Na+/H+ antiporter MnhC subunit